MYKKLMVQLPDWSGICCEKAQSIAAEPNDLCSSTDPEVEPHSFHSNTRQSLKSQSVISVAETPIGIYAYVQSTVLYCNRLVASQCCWRTTRWGRPQPGGLQEGNGIKNKGNHLLHWWPLTLLCFTPQCLQTQVLQFPVLQTTTSSPPCGQIWASFMSLGCSVSFLPWTRTTGIKRPSYCDVTAGVISVGENLFFFFFHRRTAAIHALYNERLSDSVPCHPLLPPLSHIPPFCTCTFRGTVFQFSLLQRGRVKCKQTCVGCASKRVLSEIGVFSPLMESLEVWKPLCYGPLLEQQSLHFALYGLLAVMSAAVNVTSSLLIRAWQPKHLHAGISKQFCPIHAWGRHGGAMVSAVVLQQKCHRFPISWG